MKPPGLQITALGCIYMTAKAQVKAIFFFDICCCCCHCSINTQIGNNVTCRKRHCFRFRVRSNINAPLRGWIISTWNVTIKTYVPFYKPNLNTKSKRWQNKPSHFSHTKKIVSCGSCTAKLRVWVAQLSSGEGHLWLPCQRWLTCFFFICLHI